MPHAWRDALGSRSRSPTDFPEHSLPSSRAFYWIEGQDPVKAVAFAKAAYRKYWLEGRATSDADAAAEAGATVGFKPDVLLAGMQETGVKARLLEENEGAIAKGVFGSPFFIVDGEPFWGSDRIPLVLGR